MKPFAKEKVAAVTIAVAAIGLCWQVNRSATQLERRLDAESKAANHDSPPAGAVDGAVGSAEPDPKPAPTLASIQWLESSDSRDPDKPTWTHYWSTNCGPCLQQERLFGDADVVRNSTQFNCVQVLTNLSSGVVPVDKFVSAVNAVTPREITFTGWGGVRKTARDLALMLSRAYATVGSDPTPKKQSPVSSSAEERPRLTGDKLSKRIAAFSVRVRVGREDSSFLGSGVAVNAGEHLIVLTNHHVIYDKDAGAYGKSISVLPAGWTDAVPAKIAAVDVLHDLAALAPLKTLDHAAPVVPFDPAESYHLAGFRDDGVFHVHQVTPTSWAKWKPPGAKYASVTFDRPCCQGDSGGPICTDRGEVVGLAWGSTDGAWGVCGVPFREIISRVAH